MAFSWKKPAKFWVEVLTKQTKPGAATSGPGANEVRFGELSNGKKPSSRLVARSDPEEAEVAAAEAVADDAAVLDEAADGVENSATTSINHPIPLTPTDEPSRGVRIVTLLGIF